MPLKPKLFYGYIVVWACFSIQALGWGTHNSFGILFNPLEMEFGWSRAMVSGVASLSLLLSGFAGIFMGGLSDRFGPRLIAATCGIVLGAGFVMMSYVRTWWQLYLVYGLIVGIGISATDVVLLSTAARWFVRLRSTISGIVKVGTGVGMVIMPLLMSWLIHGYGWRFTVMVLGLIIAVLVVLLSQLLVRDPARMDLLPDNDYHPVSVTPAVAETGLTFQQAIHSRAFWTLWTVFLLLIFCVYTILMHIVSHAINLGVEPARAARLLAIIGGVSIAGRLVGGAAGDRFGNKSAFVSCFVLMALALVWLQVAKNLWMLHCFAVLHGFAHGGFFALISPLVADICGTRSHGLLFGVVSFGGAIGGAMGPTMAGILFDLTLNYGLVFVLLSLITLVALGLTISLRTPVSKIGIANLGLKR